MRWGPKIGSFRRFTDETAGASRTSTFTRASAHGARNKQKKKGILLSAQVQSDQTDSLVVSVYRRSRILDRAFFEHFGFAAPEKILLFASGSLSREGISYEEDGSSDASNSGASERRVNLFLCGRRGSDPHVLAGTLQRELIRKLR